MKKMFSRFRLLLLLPFFFTVAYAATPASHILISEVQPSADSTWNEFVELFNPTNNSIDITGWSLKKKTSAGVETNYVATFPATTIPARGFFLVTHSRSHVRGMASDLNANGPYESSLQDDNTILLYNGSGTLIDKVGWGGAVDFEGSVFPTNPVFDYPNSGTPTLNRYPLEADSDKNSSDFRLSQTLPQNSSSPANVPPVLTEKTQVPVITNDNTPDYVFTSDTMGPFTYSGDCSSSSIYALSPPPFSGTFSVGVTFNTLSDGLHSNCKIVVTDSWGTDSLPLSVTPFTIDTTLTITTISSSNTTNTSYVRTGENVTVDFTVNKNIQTPSVQILGRAAIVSGSEMTWQATTTILNADSEGSTVPFVINYTDTSGNVGSPISTTNNGSTVTIDNIAPTITILNIRSDNEFDTALATGRTPNPASDIVYLRFTTSENIFKPTVHFPGTRASSASVTGPGYSAQSSGSSWIARHGVFDTDPDGTLSFEISDIVDLAGNLGTAVTTTTDGSSVTTDNTPPTLSPVTIASNNTDPTRAKVGETIKVDFTASEPLLSSEVKGNFFNRSAVVSGSGTDWDFSLAGTVTDPEGTVAFEGTATDLAGNPSSFTATTDGSSVTFDRTNPVLSTFLTTISSNNLNLDDVPTFYAKVANEVTHFGDTITLEFETSEEVQTPIGQILGHAVVPTSPDQKKWTAKYLPTNSDPEGVVPFSFEILDIAGNNLLTVSATQDGSSVIFDRTAPDVTAVTVMDLLGAATPNFKHRKNASFSWNSAVDFQENGMTTGSGVRWYHGKLGNFEYSSQGFHQILNKSWTPNLLEPSDFPYNFFLTVEDRAGNQARSSFSPNLLYSQLYSIGIEGTVVDSNGDPIENALVQVVARYGEECDTGKEICVGTTNALGQYSIVVKKDQEYNITFINQRYYLAKDDKVVGSDDLIINTSLNGLTSVHESQTANQGIEITTSEKFVGDDGLFTATSIFIYSFSGEITHTFVNGEIVVSSLGRITLIKSNNPSVTIVNNGDNTYNVQNAGKVLNTRSITEATESNSNTKLSACGTSSAYSSGNSRIGTKYIASNGSFGNTFGKYKTPSEWKSFGKRLKVGVAPQIITYINRNGYEIFAGYRKGIIGWDRYTKRFQNQVKYRGISRRNSFALTIENAPEKLQEVVTLSSRIHIMKGSFQHSVDTKEDKKEALLQELANFKPLKRIRQKDAYKGIILRNSQKSKVNKFERKSPFAKRIVRDPYAQEIKIIKMQFANGVSARVEKVIK